MKKKAGFISIRTKMTIGFIGVATLSAAMFASTLYYFYRSQIRQDFRNDLLYITAVAALQVNGDEHSLIKTPADQSLPEFENIRQVLINIHDAANAIEYPYTMRLNDKGEISFVIDSTDDEPSAIEEIYNEPGDMLKTNFVTLKEPMVEADFYTDEWGTWLSAYAPFYRSDGQREGVIGIDVAADAVLAKEKQILVLSLAVFLILLPIAILYGAILARQITRPLHKIRDVSAEIAQVDLPGLTAVAQAIAAGDLTRAAYLQVKPIEVHSHDELEQMAESQNQIIASLQKTHQAFDSMIAKIQDVIGQVADSADAVTTSAAQLASASERSGDVTRRISTTMQQVALGTARQTAGVTKTSRSVEQMNRAIDGVAKGAQEQAKAISQASQIAARINTAIDQVTNNAQAVTRDSAQAASYSRDGAKTVKETITGMEAIRAKVGLSATKVEEMGARSEEIGVIVETIEDIASQTNLLALNAAIEAARASGAGVKVNEQLLQQHLLGVADLLAELCLLNGQALQNEELVSLVRRARIGTLNISDADGVIVLSNEAGNVGFLFPEDEKQQAAVFRPLLTQREGVVVQSAQPRSQDGLMYMYVGVSRRDQAGIIQAGIPASALENSGRYTRGFAVVADEVRKLAERSRLAAKEITALIKSIQKTVSESVIAMQASAVEVESGVVRANSAGVVLDNILGAAESVYKQAEDAGNAAAKVSAAAAELVQAVDIVSAVIKEDTAATDEMAANSSELTQAIGNIASVSRENSAAVENVSAATGEVSAQVQEVSASAESLMEMARKLQQVVSRFTLNEKSA